jgi:hypothetical protein
MWRITCFVDTRYEEWMGMLWIIQICLFHWLLLNSKMNGRSLGCGLYKSVSLVFDEGWMVDHWAVGYRNLSHWLLMSYRWLYSGLQELAMICTCLCLLVSYEGWLGVYWVTEAQSSLFLQRVLVPPEKFIALLYWGRVGISLYSEWLRILLYVVSAHIGKLISLVWKRVGGAQIYVHS